MAGVTLSLPEVIRRGAAAYEQGRFEDAEQFCRAILDVKADDFNALHLLAVVQSRRGLHTYAQANFARALAVRPDHADAHRNRGISLEILKRYDEALASFDRALALRPDDARVHNNRGNVLKELKRFEEALASYDRALALRPDYAEACNNRGAVLDELRRFEEALECYDRALELRPDYAEAYNNRGIALTALKRFDEAMASIARALAIRPNYPEAHNSRGIAYYERNQYREALECYQAAIELKPDLAQAHFNMAQCQLLLGDFEHGWQENEWRWEIAQAGGVKRRFVQPQWSGTEEIAGKTILLHAEQGFGDTLQFYRYARLVAACGARVILEVQRPLKRLLSGDAGVHLVLARGEPLPHFDLHCPLLSVPRAFGAQPATIPPMSAPLRVPRQSMQIWQSRLGPQVKPRIGIAWCGRPSHKNDHNRSIALQTLLGSFALPVELISLQKDVNAADEVFLRAKSSSVAHFGPVLTDFMETAALAALMDLVVTVDTSVAHLAAALGRPTWILLPSPPDCRWMLDREDSPWYPSVRLFRQNQAGDWGVVIANVAAALSEFVADMREAEAARMAEQAASQRLSSG